MAQGESWRKITLDKVEKNDIYQIVMGEKADLYQIFHKNARGAAIFEDTVISMVPCESWQKITLDGV